MKKEGQVLTHGSRKLISKAFNLGVDPLFLKVSTEQAIKSTLTRDDKKASRNDLSTVRDRLFLALQNKKNLKIRHDGRFIVNVKTDKILTDRRTKKDLLEDWNNPDISVRRGIDDSMPITKGSKTDTWISNEMKLLYENFGEKGA